MAVAEEIEVKKLKVYDCKVILGDEVQARHIVPKKDVTEMELRLLRRIHGKDRVTEVRQTEQLNVDINNHYHELAMAYGANQVEEAFGVVLDDHDQWLADRDEQQENEREERMRREQRAAKFAPKGRAARVKTKEEVAAAAAAAAAEGDGEGEGESA